jgi:hypothetical protein
MKVILILGLLFIILSSILACQNHSCSKIPDFFESNDDAIIQIKKSNFSSIDSFSIQNGEWLTSVIYYSCNKTVGYLIYRMKSGAELYNPKVPLKVWDEFKRAIDKENYYDNNIINQYPGRKRHIVRE